jgi:hypothetical protein
MSTKYKNTPNDPNFDLDEYIREKSEEEGELSFDAISEEPEDGSAFKNAILIFMVFTAAYLWYYDWSPSQAWASVFGGDNVEVFINPAPDVNINIPEINIPDIPPIPDLNFEGGFADYLVEINNAGLNDLFSNSGYQALYQTGVPIEYLEQLNDAGYLEDDFSYSAVIGLYNGNVPVEYLDGLSAINLLDDFSYSGIIGLYNSDVPTSYLNGMSEAGYLDEFSYSAIIGFYNSDVSITYLNELQANNLLEDFSYSGIIGLYNGDVPTDYIQDLKNADYLDSFSYSAIIGMYNGGVTLDYINGLKERNLLENLSYSDIIRMYNTDN